MTHTTSLNFVRTIAGLEKKGIRTLQDLISIPTVNPPGEHYETCARFLADQLKSLGLKTRCLKVPWEVQKQLQPEWKAFPRWNVIGRYDVGAKHTLHMNAHYDVVPVSGKWRFGPFEPKLKDGWIYGRGSADMKGAIVSCLLAIEALVKSGATPTVNLEVSFTADEETGGQLGAGYIVKQKLIDADYAVVMEGGRRGAVGLGHNGVLWLEGRCLGKAAHSAWPSKGINAFEHMNAVAAELFALRDQVAQRRFSTTSIEAMSPTINIGGVFGGGTGSKVNTVAAEAHFTIDRRLVPNETLKGAERELLAASRKAKKKLPKLKLEYTTLFACDPCLGSPDEHLVQVARDCVRSVTRKPLTYEVCRGFTDLHYFRVDGNISGIGYGPDGENYHGVDERTEVREILNTAEVYARLFCSL